MPGKKLDFPIKSSNTGTFFRSFEHECQNTLTEKSTYYDSPWYSKFLKIKNKNINSQKRNVEARDFVFTIRLLQLDYYRLL